MSVLPILSEGAKASNRPGPIPNAVANARSEPVIPSDSARCRASPAPAAAPTPTPTARPTPPKGPSAKNGNVDPRPSPNFLPTESSYPGAASNGFLIAPAISANLLRAAFSVSSGNIEAKPAPAVSAKPTAPGIMPLNVSAMFPPKVVSGGVGGTALSVSISLRRSANSYCLAARIRSSSLAFSGPSIRYLAPLGVVIW